MKKPIIINCVEDNVFEQDRQILHSCNSIFTLEEQNIFYVESLSYGDDIIGQYYTICPNCGYLVLLNENILSLEQKISAQEKYISDPLLYRKNNLKSQLIYLESQTPLVAARARIRTFF